MIKTELQSNNLDLRALLDAINNLPEKGSGSGEDISEELTAQDALISEISLALDEVAIAQADAFAAIGVTYPEGSTCTCSNGTKTLTAKDTSGQALFLVPEDGTWTVTATDPADATKTKSESVSITKEGQWESVTLSYQFYLFKEGVGVADEWATEGNATLVQKTNDAIIIKSFSGYGGNNNLKAFYNSPVDLSDYTTLKAEVEANKVGGYANLCIWSSTPGTYGSPDVYASATEANKRHIVSLDISSINGEYYVGIYVVNQETLTMYNFWLE